MPSGRAQLLPLTFAQWFRGESCSPEHQIDGKNRGTQLRLAGGALSSGEGVQGGGCVLPKHGPVLSSGCEAAKTNQV